MESLRDDGVFSVDAETKAVLAKDFKGLYCSEDDTYATIGKYFKDYGYLCDPHTAVALYCADLYVKESGDTTPMVVASTASPYKFPRAVLSAVGGDIPAEDFDCVTALEAISGVTAPANLSALRTKEVRFTRVAEKAEIDLEVEAFAAKKL